MHAASSLGGPLAPNTLATLYGTGLAQAARGLLPGDLAGPVMPSVLPGTGVRVSVGGRQAHLLFVSPGQINFLIPSDLTPGVRNLQVGWNGLTGPPIPLTVEEAAPEVFHWDGYVVGQRFDGSVASRTEPARPGEALTVWATGLGRTVPPAIYGQVAQGAAALERSGFVVLLDGVAAPVSYAGLAPGFAGLYQINLRVPESAGDWPVMRLGFPDGMSRAAVRLPVRR